jgi:predicted sugar kinase
MSTERRGAVALQAPGRLHLGFLDPGASLGRAFGSLGLVIDGFETRVELSAASVDRVTADTPAAQVECDRAAEMLLRLRRLSGRT